MSSLRVVAVAAAMLGLGLAGCGHQPASPVASHSAAPALTTPAATALASTTAVPAILVGAQPQLASDPAQIGADLVSDELALRDPATPQDALAAAAHREQVAYRAIGRNPEWDPIIRPQIPPELLGFYDRNIEARRQLAAMAIPKDTLPAWRIQPPPPPEELMGYYREAEAATGVGWNYLAAINFIETRFGSIDGVSTAGAQGPMQFLPSTFAGYGDGGDIRAPRDSIMAAGRYLAANGFATNPDGAIFRYNHADQYVAAVNQYAAAMAEDPAAFGIYHRWNVYYVSTAGDVLLPIGFDQSERIPVQDYLASHPQ
ncbi:transglycosylase SLT domain-containing protein [Mycobacterium sp. M26]|uniref:lytic transglycosylase domain-containing protein n=1 Tax=Mycobacterium sp. M26 TaxID=1762962 RepID=UPI00073EB098|nr:transglycosylase SLT domain-containing protein [Mycobacterium sp. M26]